MRLTRLALAMVFALLCGLIPTSPAGAGVGMVTGSKTGTYIRFGQDIARVAEAEGLEIEVKESEGSLANIERMNSRENAGFGIVQSDVLGILEASAPDVAKRLRLIYPLYNEEVHLFARKDIRSLRDLEGKSFAMGTPGSGNWLTASNLLRMARVTPGRKITDMAPLDAVSAVLEGRVDAMIYVAGKPVAIFQKLERLKNEPRFAPLLDQVHFVPITDSRFLDSYYVASELTPRDYSFMKTPVKTIAVKALLVAFDFSGKSNAYYRMRCDQLNKLGRIIRTHLDELKAKGHPKWKTVDLNASLGKWKKDECVHGPSPMDGDTPGSHEIYDRLKGMFE